MKKILILLVLVTLGAGIYFYFYPAYHLAQQVNEMPDRKFSISKVKYNPLNDKGELVNLTFEVCPQFGHKLFSENSPHADDMSGPGCGVEFRGNRLFLYNFPAFHAYEVMKDSMGSMEEKDMREFLEYFHEAKKPEVKKIYLRKNDFEIAQLFLMGKTSKIKDDYNCKKMDNSQYTIYLCHDETSEDSKETVIFFSDEKLYTCEGNSCFDYIRLVGLI